MKNFTVPKDDFPVLMLALAGNAEISPRTPVLFDGNSVLSVPDTIAPAVQSILADPHWRTAPQRAALLAAAERVRLARETAGITVNAITVATDTASQARLTAMAHHARDNPAVLSTWQNGPGNYVVLTAAQILGLHAAMVTHVQACLKVEAETSARIAAGTLTTEAEIDAAFAAIG